MRGLVTAALLAPAAAMADPAAGAASGRGPALPGWLWPVLAALVTLVLVGQWMLRLWLRRRNALALPPQID